MRDAEEGRALERGITADEARQAAPENPPEEVAQQLKGVPVERKHQNIGQTFIEVTGDRAKIVFTEAADKLSQRRDWSGPLGLFVGLGTSLLTADFQDTLGVEAATVTGVVVAVTFLSFLWTGYTVLRALRTPSKKKVVDETIDALKHQGPA